MSEKKVKRITIYKLKETFNRANALREYTLYAEDTTQDWKYQVYIKAKKHIPPSWKPLVEDLVPEEPKIPTNSYSSLVLLLEKGKNLFAVTAGYGYVDVRDYGVRDYGIEIARKTLNPNELTNLYQKSPLGNVYGWSRNLRGRYIPENDSINDRSVLKALSGKLSQEILGSSLDGRTSLALSGGKSFEDLIKVLNKLQEIESKEEYKVKIHGLEEVAKELHQTLEEMLVSHLDSGNFDNYMFGYDDDLFFRNCAYIKVGADETTYLFEDIEGVINSAVAQNTNSPSSVKIRGYNDADLQVIKDKKLIDLIEGELDYADGKYFRINRKWYKTNEDYRLKLEEDFSDIEKVDSSYLKPWPKTAGSFIHETDFINLNESENFLVAHTKNVNHIEIADLIDTDTKNLVHIKKGKGAYLRNLFSQGYVSASLITGDADFKDKASSKFGLDLSPDYSVLFAIFPENETNIDSIFTLFAKADFLERVSALRELGYSVKYCIVQPE